MDLRRFLSWRLALLLLLMPCGFQSVSVYILNEDPMHVISGKNLLLRARIEHGPQEEISMVTWEREPETGSASGKVTLATCPGESGKCAGTKPHVHANMEQQETTLQINGYNNRVDGGIYSVTVTDCTGAKSTVYCIVREYEPVHYVSISINVSHSSLVCGEAWGTDPHFSWFHERVAISQAVGRVSLDGTTLFITMTPICGHFTCIVGNELGYTSATYTAAPCETEGRGMTAAVVCLVLLLLLVGGALVFVLWRRYRHSNRRERLQEHLDDNI